MKEMTQMDKLRRAFATGKSLTARQIASRYKIASPHKVISNLRNREGLNIQGKQFTTRSGHTALKYQLSRDRATA